MEFRSVSTVPVECGILEANADPMVACALKAIVMKMRWMIASGMSIKYRYSHESLAKYVNPTAPTMSTTTVMFVTSHQTSIIVVSFPFCVKKVF